MAAAGEPDVAYRIFRHYYGLLRAGETGKLSTRDIEAVEDAPDVSRLAPYADPGRRALERTVVVKLKGGIGTSMGMTEAKSLLPVKNGLSFLDVIVRQTLHLRRTLGVRLPLVLMNSFRTRRESLAVLARHPGIATDLPADFMQHKVPRIRKDDLAPVSWPRAPQHEWCPPGHGDIYPALLSSRFLEALLARGFEYLCASNADNLGALLDPALLGYVAVERIPFLMEVIDRTEADRKGGHVARLADGRFVLREIAQCPDDEIQAFQDVALHRYFNANNLWVNLRTLRAVLDRTAGVLGLPMIVNEKPVDPEDPTSTRVIQLETAMGAAVSVFEGARIIRVPRARVVPVKTTSDLLGLWSDAYEMTDDCRIVPSASRPDSAHLVVDLDDTFYRRVQDLDLRFPNGPPSLVGCRRLVVRGDVRFGRNVVVRGDASIDHRGAEPLVVPDGARLGTSA
ncbi:MAG: UTP--glucose-1-phosphate uridylyltransferase [Actinobacteria bacterium]|nr:UTP--glucose-1-phosphate uridylyltransferase [Actinomycetota bacterium]